MERREALRQQLAEQPLEAIVEQMLALEEQLRQKEEQLAEAQAFIAELKRQLFGPKAEKLSSEEQAQLDEIARDLREQKQRPEPLCQQVLEEEQKTQRARRPPRAAAYRVPNPHHGRGVAGGFNSCMSSRGT